VSKYYQFYIKIISDYSNQLISSSYNTAINIWDGMVDPADIDNKNTTALAASCRSNLPIG
jgi:hypothetical protein